MNYTTIDYKIDKFKSSILNILPRFFRFHAEAPNFACRGPTHKSPWFLQTRYQVTDAGAAGAVQRDQTATGWKKPATGTPHTDSKNKMMNLRYNILNILWVPFLVRETLLFFRFPWRFLYMLTVPGCGKDTSRACYFFRINWWMCIKVQVPILLSNSFEEYVAKFCQI